jgi:serine/threonine protein kinase
MSSDNPFGPSPRRKTERWERIDRLLQSALECEPAKRAALLQEQCNGDDALLQEVVALLSAHEKAGSFLESPPLNVGTTPFAAEHGALVGQKIGPYELDRFLGAGGMGEVYRATDTRLGRLVAIKFLPAHLSRNAESRLRLEREARAISRLNHPHICTLYDVGEHEDIDYLVMEYLEGETLADRLTKGPLPLHQALKYGIELADALSSAHRHGITHRDLKPGNIVLTRAGIKLLDFGLAKLGTPTSSRLATSIPNDVQTVEGTIVGTIQYMAPEQLEGAALDSRTDIFAFGAVLYEMITGLKAFEGKSQASLIAAILTSAPRALSKVQPLIPNALDQLVRRCLEKDPEERWQSAFDVKKQLEWIAGQESESATTTHAGDKAPRSSWMKAGMVASVLIAVLSLGGMFFYARNTAPNAEEIEFTFAAPAGTTFSLPGYGAPVISPDGSHIVFPASRDGQTLLYVRSLNSLDSLPLAGTEDAHHPFWSPDNHRIGFFAGGKLKSVGVSGEAPRILCNVSIPSDNQGKGGTWNRYGDIVFATTRSEPLYRVSELGGTPQKVTTLDASRNEESHRWPYFLPDGRHFIYLARGGSGAVYAGSIDSDERTLLFENQDSNVIYAPPGYLLFVQDENLMARPFDATHLKITGDPFRVAGPVGVVSMISRASFSASENGKLILNESSASDFKAQLVRFDRNGKRLAVVGTTSTYPNFRLSWDGRHVSFSRQMGLSADSQKLWLLDLATGNQSLVNPENSVPWSMGAVWSRDDSQLYFSARPLPDGPENIYRTTLRGAGKPERILGSEQFRLFPLDVSRDNRLLVVLAIPFRIPAAKADLWFTTLTPEVKTEKFLETPFAETGARLSPDSQWVAYASDESGRFEVYVRKFPSAESKIPISTEGGTAPTWRDDGKEIVYVAKDNTLMSVQLEEGKSSILQPGIPKPLFKSPGVLDQNEYGWARWQMSPDGQFFYILLDDPHGDTVPAPIRVKVNWTASLKR